MNTTALKLGNELVLTRTVYYEIRREVRARSGFFGELAAAEALDNAIKHGVHARVSLEVGDTAIKLVVTNRHKLRVVDECDPGGFGLVILQVLMAQGVALSFDHRLEANAHVVTLTIQRTDTDL